MNIVYFERQPANHSIERVFETVRGALPRYWKLKVVHCPTPHHSFFWLPQGIFRAWSEKGEVNHIAGDVYYAALGLPAARSILTVHDLNRLHDLKGLRGTLFRLFYFTIPLRHCAVITAISQATRDRIVEEFPFSAEKIVVIPNPFPLGYSPRPKCFNSDCPRILQVGTAPHKNLGRVIQAIKGLRCKLHIIGPLSNEYQGLLESSHIEHENSVNVSDAEMVNAYDRADLVAFVSLSEGFGMPIIEAQAMGRPVVVSNLSPMKEVAGDGAITVDPFDIADIRKSIQKVLDDGVFRDQVIECGIKNIRRFDPEAVAEEYARLYRKIAKYN
jgi:glycosyltransferase involved in cell wall biosynthesis